MNQLFVYGTLCPNKANAHILEQIGGTWTKASVRGIIHILDWGPDQGLKAIVLDPQAEWVEGYLFSTFSTEKLTENWQMLDDFEGFQYERVIVDVMLESGETVKAWTYQMNAHAKNI
ncbi:gamma-glutamylcyclotransferase family protein [Acinetobacter lactucae]|uniref:gamma-glutamylcyclotransferase family protein n=1 Tax=Acinetobacter lactucae TaxID=1785128 RepID=UPI000F7A7599|nr:gamma-glutamylcyclotransferase family protein [Acinetobacter lactucae]RSO37394.1 gamma-glutamylcyclotransferase [Acinetobacter lactucae]